jgi:hypothetical protein
MDGTGLVCCSLTGFGISDVELPGTNTRDLLSGIYFSNIVTI